MSGRRLGPAPPVLTPAVLAAALAHLRAGDPVLAAIIARVGEFGMRYREPDFETLVRSIIYQQISGKAAAAIFGRLQAASRNGERITAEGVLGLDPAGLRQLGLSQQKAAYVRDLAEKAAAGLVDFGELPRLPDDLVVERLTAVRGVGVWTAQMFLIFALRRPDVLPVSDLGIRAAVTRAYRLRKPPGPARIEKLARPWRPYASIASWYLWRSLDNFATL
ncbi:MAG: DNA-3-methyladenine glycosylase [Candidatus Methylomirabilales bacterium]